MILRLARFTICVVCARAVDNLCIGNVYYVFATKKDPRNVLQDSMNVHDQRTFLNKSSYLMHLASYLCKMPAIYDTLPAIYAQKPVICYTSVICCTETKIDVFKPMTRIFEIRIKIPQIFLFFQI